MAEQVVIDIKLENLDKAQKGLDELTRKQIEQQDAIKATREEIKNYEKEIRELNKAQEEGKELTDTETQLLEVYNTNLQTAKEKLVEQKDSLSDVNKERRNAQKEIDLINTAMTAEIGSNEQLRAQLKLLTTEYDQLSQEQRENTEEGQNLTEQIKGLSDKLKENEGAIGDNRRNVGNYEEAVTKALGSVNIFGVNIGALSQSIKDGTKNTGALIKETIVSTGVQESQAAVTASQTVAQKAYNAAILAGRVALNIFKLALLATGIGAFLVAVGSVTAFFNSTERGALQLKIAMAALGSVVDNVKDVFIGIGETIVNAFNNPQQAVKDLGKAILDNIIQRGKSALNIFKSIATLDFKQAGEDLIGIFAGIDVSADKAATAAKRFAIQLKNDAKEAIEAQKIENDLIQTKRDLQLENAKLEGQFAKLRAEAADKENLTQAEIIKKLEQAEAIKTQQINNNIKIAETELDILNRRAALAENSLEFNDEIAAKQVEVAQLESTLETETLRIKKQIATEKFTLATETLAAELKLIEANGELTLSKEIDIEEKKREAILAQTNLSEIERQAVIAESQAKINALIFDALKDELDEQEKYLTLKQLELDEAYFKELTALGDNEEAKKELTDRYNAEKLQAQREAIEAQIQIVSSELDQLTASTEGGIAESILTEPQKEELKLRLQELQTELAKTGFEMKKLGDEADGVNSGGRSLADRLGIPPEKVEEIKAAYQTTLNGIESAISIANQRIQQSTEDRIAAVDRALENGTISEKDAERKKERIRKEAFEKQKKLQKATATVNYLQGLVSIWANSYATIPNPIAAAIVAAVNSAILTATFGANIAQINNQKFAEGGLLVGRSHAQGGIPMTVNGQGGYEAEGGEYIMKKSAVNSYGVGFMEAINNMRLPKLFADGGLITPTPPATVGTQVGGSVNSAVASLVNRDIRVINVEKDFTRLQNRVSNVEQARTY